VFSLSDKALDPARLQELIRARGAGAYAAFEGWVRDHNDGREVARLTYEAYPPLAIREGEAIVREACVRFGLHHAACVHRVGTLEIGALAVWVGVSAAHRGEAFAACRFIIDEVKHRVPIWKQEHYVDGVAAWVRCDACAAAPTQTPTHDCGQHAIAAEQYYARQMVLPEVGSAGQKKLARARVLVVGAGGLGAGALPYLVAAGVGRVGICDDDLVDVSNLHRQVIYDVADVGRSKAERAAERLRGLNPLVCIESHAERLHESNAEDVIAPYDVVLDCTDNFETKFLLNDLCVQLGKTLFQASIYQYEGQLFVYRPGGGPCLRCIWPEALAPDCVGSCAEVGVLGAVPGVFGAVQAMEVIKELLELPGRLQGATLFFDLLSLQTRVIRAERRASCAACGAGGESAMGGVVPEVEPAWLFTPAAAAHAVIDLRSAGEAAADPIPIERAQVVPLETLDLEHLPFMKQRFYVFCCPRGMRSRLLVRALRAQGFTGAVSLRGGIAALRRARRDAPEA